MSLVRQQQRRDTTANWVLYNPVLLDGELGLDTTVDRFKVGDGVTTWAGLPYADRAEEVAADAARAEAAADAAVSVVTGDLDDANALLLTDSASDTARGVAGLAAAAATRVLDPTDVGYDVWLVSGQSNGSSRGLPIDATNFDIQSPRVQQFPAVGPFASQIIQASDPLGHPDSIALAPLGVGPGFVFARWLLQAIPENRRVLLVPAAYGGTGFSTSYPLTWDPAAAVGSLYLNAIAQANAAMLAAGPNARFAGIIWIQGEQDSSMSTAAYAAKLDALIAGFRSSITGASATTPFIVGRMTPGYVTVNTGAKGVEAAHIDTPSRVAYTAVSPGPSGYDDNLHYTAGGQRIVGRNLFTAYLTAKAAATTVPLTAPPAPPGLAVAVTSTGATLSWTPLGRTASYKVEQSTDGGTTWTTVAATVYGNTQAITGLTAATYRFRVTGVNAAGTGTPSTLIYTFAAPGQVTGVSSPSQTSTAVTLTWTAVAVGAQPVTYVMESSSDSGATWTPAPVGTITALTGTVTGLTGSTSYRFRVTAKSAGITGTPSASLTQSTSAPVTITDAFTRADSTSTLGSPWVPAPSGVWGIRSNMAYLVSTTRGGSAPYDVATYAVGASDGTVSVDVIGTSIDVGAYGLAARISDVNNYIGARFGGNVVQLYRVVAGSIQTIGTYAYTHSSSGTINLSFVMNGSTIVVKAGGTTVATVTETFNQNATGHGLWGIATSATVSLDNFSFVG